jgi:hypothetical protein
MKGDECEQSADDIDNLVAQLEGLDAKAKEDARKVAEEARFKKEDAALKHKWDMAMIAYVNNKEKDSFLGWCEEGAKQFHDITLFDQYSWLCKTHLNGGDVELLMEEKKEKMKFVSEKIVPNLPPMVLNSMFSPETQKAITDSMNKSSADTKFDGDDYVQAILRKR